MARPHARRLGRLIGLTCAAAVATPAAAAAAAPPTIVAKPGLYPKFSPGVTDYVSRCEPGRPLHLVIRPPGARAIVKLGRRPPSSRTQRATLRMSSGQAIVVRVSSGRHTATYYVRCLKRDFPKWTTGRPGRPRAKWYIVTPTLGTRGSRYVALFDNKGVPVWWMRLKVKPMDAKLLPDGNLAWSVFTGTQYASHSVPYEERRLDGKRVRRIAAVGAQTDSHDMQVLPNGNYLVVSYVPRDGVDLSQYGGPAAARVVDAEVQEVTPRGRRVWSWNSKDHLALSESAPFIRAVIGNPYRTADGRDVYDITHVNSVERDGGSLLISLRQTDAVYRVSRATGAVQWKLGGTRTPESLSVAGEPDGSLVFGGQHDARVLADGTITLHDNRTGTGLLPRALRFRVDAAARTATKLEEITDPLTVPSLCCGSARRIAGGHWVMSWGFNSLITELGPFGQRVFALHFGKTQFSYRAIPVMPGELTTRTIRAGMDAMHPPASALP
jgi:hypothetical protein